MFVSLVLGLEILEQALNLTQSGVSVACAQISSATMSKISDHSTSATGIVALTQLKMCV